MTATVPLRIRSAGGVFVIPGTELVGEFKGSGYRGTSMLVSRFDGRVVRLPPLLYAVVEALMEPPPPTDEAGPAGHPRGVHTLATVAAAVNSKTSLSLTSDHVRFILDRKLAPLGITTQSDGSPPTVAKPIQRLALRWKTPIIPPAGTWILGGPFSWLFRAPVVAVAVAAALAAEAWILGTAPVGRALEEALSTPGGLLLILLIALVSAFFHEIGHAAACRYGGARPGAMGCGLYIVWPVFYTDVTSSYRLGRRDRLRIDLAGVYFNALVVVGLAALYASTAESLLLAAILMVNVEILQQLLPFLRFDGYYVVSDVVGVPDLFRYVGPILRRRLLRQEEDPRLAELKAWPQRIVTAWVLIVIPALIAQLVILGLQMPDLIRALGDRTMALADATSFVELTGALMQVLLLALPLAGILLIIAMPLRGAWAISHAKRSDVTQTQPDAIGEAVPGPRSGPTSHLRAPSPPRASALASTGLTAAIFLLLAAGMLSLRFVGGSSTQVAGASDSSQGPSEQSILSRLEAGSCSFDRRSDRDAGPRRNHVPSPTYSVNPPAGGNHDPQPAPAGDFSGGKVPPDGQIVHAMEHGYVVLWYKPGLPADAQMHLRGVFARHAGEVLLVPRSSLPTPVAATAWERRLLCGDIEPAALDLFISSFRDQGPEKGFLSNERDRLPDGVSRPQKALTANPPRLEFDKAAGAGPARAVTVRNTGLGAVEIRAARVTGPDAGDFSISQDSCMGARLPAGGECSLTITFNPAAPGPRSADLTLDAGSHLLTVPLRGESAATTTLPPQRRAVGRAAVVPEETPSTLGPPPEAPPAAPRDRIVFNSGRDGNVEIYTMKPDGSDVARLTDHPADDSWPKWSPDKTRIAFHSARSGNDEIYVMNADGTGLVQLTNDPATDVQPDWSPDGHRIVFTSTRAAGAANLYVMNADGTNPTRITNGPWVDVAPSWSPDGSRIAFATSRDGNYEIYLVNPDGSGVTRLTENGAPDYDPSWSPDGKKLAFWRDEPRLLEPNGNGEIYVMNGDGTLPTRLTTNLVADGFPSWSRDGAQLAFVSSRDGNGEIYVMPSSGDGLLGLLAKRITNDTAIEGVPNW